jgi:hypothetical protein
MKTDHSFKVIAAVIIAGVIVAFASPAHSTTAQPKSTVATPAHSTTAADLSQ